MTKGHAPAETAVPEPPEEPERGAWQQLGLEQLERAYGPDEPEYTEADLKDAEE
jgi:hypothetical protein